MWKPIPGACAAILLLTALSQPASARPMATPPHLRLPASARPLCSEHVSGTTMHISWTSYAVRESVAETVGFFRSVGLTLTRDTEGDGFSAAPNTRDRVMVHPADGRYPSCAERPRRGERAVIIRSRSMG